MRAVPVLMAMLGLALATPKAEAYAWNNGHYVSGHVVHSPSCGREHLHQTAIYHDGSVSFSEHHRGAFARITTASRSGR